MRQPTYVLASLLLLLALSTNVRADEDGSYVGYDAIVSELKASAEDIPKPAPANDWEEVALHAGIGLSTSLVSFHLPDGNSGSGLFKGLQVSGGFNLFSRDMRAEAAYSSYQHESFDGNMGGDLKEFEARIVYSPRTSTGMIARLGAGLAARYMDITVHGSGRETAYNVSTPTSLLLFGLEKKVGKSIAVGPDISYRSAIGGATIDKTSWDASLRLNATF